jgi:hypothetical protein
MVKTKLDESNLQQPEWNYDPSPLNVAGGMWDDVPLQSSIPNLAGDGPSIPTWDSLREYEAPEWYRGAKFGIRAHWTPQCVPNFATALKEINDQIGYRFSSLLSTPSVGSLNVDVAEDQQE